MFTQCTQENPAGLLSQPLGEGAPQGGRAEDRRAPSQARREVT